jgi:hypothetical protein
MTDERDLYMAVAECRRLVAEGMNLPAAAAEAGERYGIHPMHIGEHAGRAIHSCRKARRWFDE